MDDQTFRLISEYLDSRGTLEERQYIELKLGREVGDVFDLRTLEQELRALSKFLNQTRPLSRETGRFSV